MESKICRRCKIEKLKIDFHVKRAECKDCSKISDKEYYQRSPKAKPSWKRQQDLQRISKICSDCRIDKPISDYILGYHHCRPCYNAYRKKRYAENEDVRKKERERSAHKWKNTTPEGKIAHREKDRIYQSTPEARAKKKLCDAKRNCTPEAKEKARTRKRLKMVRDIQYKLASYIRTRLYGAIKRGCGYKRGSAVKDLGCTLEELKIHLESKFQTGMSWENYGNTSKSWSMDHIVPLSSFNLNDRQHFILANYYLNLQPMWHLENISKGNREIVLIASS